MYCAKCGARLEDSASKCDRCGAPVRIRRAAADGDQALAGKKEREAGRDSLQDPVFFEEAGRDVDVNSIIRIARGEDPAKAKGDLSQDSEKGAFRQVEIRRSPADRKPSKNTAISREDWLASMSTVEKLRRRVRESLRLLEEKADRKAMQRHIERAEKYYANLESADRDGSGHRAHAKQQSADSAESEKTRKASAESILRQEKARREKERLDKNLREEEAQRARREEERREEAQRARREEESREEAQRARREEERREEAQRALREEELREKIRKEKERREKERREKEEIQKAARRARERQAQEQIRLAGMALASYSDAGCEDEAALTGPAAGASGTAAKEAREKAPVAEAAAASAKAPAEAASAKAPAEAAAPAAAAAKAPAETASAKAPLEAAFSTDKAQEKSALQEEASSSRQGISEERRIWSREELALENARRLRRMREDEIDGVDGFLAKYGLARETAVRLAILFLIALLSVIYVMGRGKSSAAQGAEEEMTGAPSSEEAGQETDSEDISGQSEEEYDIPTGGGDFQNTQTP